MAKRTFSDVSFVAEHVPETHRTLENDHTVTSVELPGMVTVYLVIDGGRLPFTQLRGADVLEAIDRAASQRQTQRGTTGSQPAVAQTQQQPPQWTQTQAPPEAQAPAEPTAPYEQTDPTAPDTQQQQPPAVPGAPFKESALGIDLSARIVGSTAIVASPADNTETIIASVTVPGGLSYATGVLVVAWVAFTVGTSGTAVNLRIRQTDVAGAVKAATGATNEGVTAATQLGTRVAWALDTAPVDGQIYKATLTVTGGAAASTVSGVFLGAIAVQMDAPWLGRAGYGEIADRLPLNYASKALEKSAVVKTGDGWLCGFTVTSTNVAAQFVLIFDARDLPPEGAVPLIGKSVPAGDAISFEWLRPRRFEAGLVLCNSTTQGSKTLGAADCLFDAQYVQEREPVPIISGGGGGGGNTTAQVVASGKVLPTGDPTGVTVDTTTYANPVEGVDKLTTLVFPLDTAALAIAISGDAFPRWILASDGADGLYLGDGTIDAYNSGAFLQAATIAAQPGIAIGFNASVGHLVLGLQAGAAFQAARLDQVSPLFTVTSGALESTALVSGAGTQISLSRDVEVHTDVTFNPGAATTATCKVELSPDNVTYTILTTWVEPAGVAFDGTVKDIVARVPASWYLKLTVVNAAIGNTKFY